MLYIGYFSFDERESERQPHHGYFTCLVDTDGMDSATRMFKEHILTLKETAKIFSDIVAVYLEDIVVVYDSPKKSLLVRFQYSEGQFPKSVSRSLTTVDPSGLDVYGRAPEIEREEVSSQQHRETEPFIEF
jgi:hypothetical protein